MLTSLSDAELIKIQRPAQYLGGELNSIVKQDAEVDVHFALAFPDTYEVGMSHLGMQILYDLLNRDPGVWAERVLMIWAPRSCSTMASLKCHSAKRAFMAVR